MWNAVGETSSPYLGGNDPNYAMWSSYYQQQMQSWYSNYPSSSPAGSSSSPVASSSVYGTGQYQAPPPLPPPPPPPPPPSSSSASSSGGGGVGGPTTHQAPTSTSSLTHNPPSVTKAQQPPLPPGAPPPPPPSNPGYFTTPQPHKKADDPSISNALQPSSHFPSQSSFPPPPKEDNWSCAYCKNVNLSKKIHCDFCKAPKSVPSTSYGYGTRGNQETPVYGTGAHQSIVHSYGTKNLSNSGAPPSHNQAYGSYATREPLQPTSEQGYPRFPHPHYQPANQYNRGRGDWRQTFPRGLRRGISPNYRGRGRGYFRGAIRPPIRGFYHRQDNFQQLSQPQLSENALRDPLKMDTVSTIVNESGGNKNSDNNDFYENNSNKNNPGEEVEKGNNLPLVNHRPGDWDCSNCGNTNNSFRKKCQKCFKNQSLEDIVHGGELPNCEKEVKDFEENANSKAEDCLNQGQSLASNFLHPSPIPRIDSDDSKDEIKKGENESFKPESKQQNLSLFEKKNSEIEVRKESTLDPPREKPSISQENKDQPDNEMCKVSVEKVQVESSSDGSNKHTLENMVSQNVSALPMGKDEQVISQLNNEEPIKNDVRPENYQQFCKPSSIKPGITETNYAPHQDYYKDGESLREMCESSSVSHSKGHYQGGAFMHEKSESCSIPYGKGYYQADSSLHETSESSAISHNKGYYKNSANTHKTIESSHNKGYYQSQIADTYNGSNKYQTPYRNQWNDKSSYQSQQNTGSQTYKMVGKGSKSENMLDNFSSKNLYPSENNFPQSESCEKENSDSDELSPKEKRFDQVFKSWEENFEKWKDANRYNPDRQYVSSQLEKMEELRAKMLERRENLRSQRLRQIEMKRKWSEGDSTIGLKVMKTKDEDDESFVIKQEDSEDTSTNSHITSLNQFAEKKRNTNSSLDDTALRSLEIVKGLSPKDFENLSKAVRTLNSRSESANDSFLSSLGNNEEGQACDSSLPDFFGEKAFSGVKPSVSNPSIHQSPGSSSDNIATNSSKGFFSDSSKSLFTRRPNKVQWGNWEEYDKPFMSKADEDYWNPGETIDYGNQPRGFYEKDRLPPFLRRQQSNYSNKDNVSNINFVQSNSEKSETLTKGVEVIDYGHKRLDLGFKPSDMWNETPSKFVNQTQNLPLPVRRTSLTNTNDPLVPHKESSFTELHLKEGLQIGVNDLVQPPGRYTRPPKIVIIFRGLPGSGKTYSAKALKNLETEFGLETPRILALDDYFECDGKYEFDKALEETYRQSLIKSFKKQVQDGYFNFIMVDCINSKTKHYEAMVSHASEQGFSVYIAELEASIVDCAERNIHNRKTEEIELLIKDWEDTPRQYDRLDLTSLFEEPSQENVENKDMDPEKSDDKEADSKNEEKEEVEDVKAEEDTQDNEGAFKLSKWEIMDNANKLARLDDLDGVSEKARMKLKQHRSIEDWLELENYKNNSSTNGKKRVRWADVEEKLNQEKIRDVGFVVGQTNWSRMMDPTEGQSALTQTKIIPNRFEEKTEN